MIVIILAQDLRSKRFANCQCCHNSKLVVHIFHLRQNFRFGSKPNTFCRYTLIQLMQHTMRNQKWYQICIQLFIKRQTRFKC